MKTFKTATLITLLLAIGISTKAQETSQTVKDPAIKVALSADLVSHYVWRGEENGHAAIQPEVGISYKGLSFSVWGSYGIIDTNDDKEIDLTLTYTTGGFTIGIADIWYGTDNRYFLYDAHRTSHTFEANIGYDFDFLSLNWFTIFAGNDGVNKNDKRAYSSYVEITAPFTAASLNWEATVGAVPYATTFYTNVNRFAITNVSLNVCKEFAINKKCTLPVFTMLSANPCTQKLYFVFGAGIRF